MNKQLAAFVESLRQTGLLNRDKVEQIAAWAEKPDADPQVIAKEIVQRGWLTPFQVKAVWKGHAGELILNQYVIVDRLGEGGMGEVFKARHRRMERDVALKVIRKEKLNSPEAVRRFHQEIQTAAQLSHENVVMAYDADQAGDRHFFAMEFVEGVNLAKLVKDKGPLDVPLACDYIRQAALGLQHALERGMVHRDIKPSNLLLGKGGIVKILDMGLARLEESPSGVVESRITQEGLAIGTPDFLSPEQARNARNADIRADIYALGCSFYYLLCGHPPYPGGTPTEKMLRHTTDAIPAITRPGVPPAVEAIVQKMMAKKLEGRYQTPAEVAIALQPFTGHPPVSSGQHPRPVVPATPPGAYAPAPLPLPPEEPGTDSHFRLPPPKPLKETAPERTRWNLPIAIVVGIAVIGIASVVVYVLFRNASEQSGPVLDKEFRNRHDMVFVLIPAGSFEMGSSDSEAGRGADEGPVHTVEISKPFYMGTTEVTLKQYQSVMRRLPEGYVRLSKKDQKEPEDLDIPATMISHGEALTFCKKLNEESSSRKEGWEYRLPTEAEWEYACRAGTKTRYNVGENLGHDQAAFGEAGGKTPGKVGQYPPNAWGLYDMHGGAAEWVADLYDPGYYRESPPQDPTGPERRAKYLIRGGSFIEPAEACRCARRLASYPELAKDYENSMRHIGFRVVLAQVKPTQAGGK